MTNSNLQKIIDIVHKLQEEMVANSVGGGHIAGTKEAGDCLLYTSPSPRDLH